MPENKPEAVVLNSSVHHSLPFQIRSAHYSRNLSETPSEHRPGTDSMLAEHRRGWGDWEERGGEMQTVAKFNHSTRVEKSF